MSHGQALTRRRFLKAGAAGAMGLLLAGCGLADDQDSTPLARLARLRHQLSSEEYRQVVITWTKANAAVPLGKAAGLHLSAEMLYHWLYGEGQPLDVSTLLLEALRPSQANDGTGPGTSPERYFSASLSHAIREGLWFRGRPFWLPEHLGGFDNTHEMSAERDLHLDVHLALGRYRMRLRGHSLLRYGVLHVVLQGPIEISDTYDWINETCEGAGPFELCQSDMRFLESYGLGHDYEVTAWLGKSGDDLILDSSMGTTG